MGRSLVASKAPLLEAQLKAALNLIPAHTLVRCSIWRVDLLE
jgi:hypothetical protein